uniref:Uncharacterized protein n=1 Tax=Acrobeloides nanus TaxID=290746 RepID=A0A914D247_9BILA
MANIQKPQLQKAHSTSEKYAVMNYNMKDSSKSSLTNSDGSLNNSNQTNIEATNDHYKRQMIYETIKAIRDEVSSFKYISVNEQTAFGEAYSVTNLNHIDTENLSKKLAEVHKDKKRLHEANKLEQKRIGIYLQKYKKIQQIINTANNDQPLEMLKYREALEVCVKITREAYTKTIKEPSEDNEIFKKYILDMRIYASYLQNDLKESILAVLNLNDKV